MKLDLLTQFRFQTIKRCRLAHVQATLLFKIISTGMFQKEAIFC